MKALIALAATTLTMLAAASSGGAASHPDIGRWSAVQPSPRLWVAPDGAVGRWAVRPAPRHWRIGRF